MDVSSCAYRYYGCSDARAYTMRPVVVNTGGVDDGTCQYHGCKDSTASNYDPTATVNHDCVYTVRGCTDSAANNNATFPRYRQLPPLNLGETVG